MQRRAGLALVVAVAVASAIGWWQWTTTQRNVTHGITGSGIIEVTEVDVAFEVPGTILERFVDEGVMVDKGEPIARLDDREYRLQVDRAAAARAAADARYRLVVKGPRGQDIDQALSAVEAAVSMLDTTRRDFDRAKQLYQQQVVSRAEFDRVSTAFTGAQAALDQARARLDILQEGARTEEIEEARARLRETEKALAIAELNLSRCQLFAPVAGRVLSKNREAGETVPAGASVVTLGDLSRPWLNLYIGERDLGKVHLGMPARVTVDSFPTQPFDGTVTFIADKAEFTPKNIQTPDERVKLVYRVKVEVTNRDEALKPGMPADGALEVNHDDSVQ